MSKYLEKLRNFRQAVKQNGGIIGSYLQIFRTDELKYGNLVGIDKYGNKYFENKSYFIARSRWIDYAPKYGYDFDGSQVPADWHRWLHYMTDDPPSKVKPCPDREWMIDHEQNWSGTTNQYVPYSTVKPKIKSWVPPKNN